MRTASLSLSTGGQKEIERKTDWLFGTDEVHVHDEQQSEISCVACRRTSGARIGRREINHMQTTLYA